LERFISILAEASSKFTEAPTSSVDDIISGSSSVVVVFTKTATTTTTTTATATAAATTSK
jgi:hypothetical protein